MTQRQHVNLANPIGRSSQWRSVGSADNGMRARSTALGPPRPFLLTVSDLHLRFTRPSGHADRDTSTFVVSIPDSSEMRVLQYRLVETEFRGRDAINRFKGEVTIEIQWSRCRRYMKNNKCCFSSAGACVQNNLMANQGVRISKEPPLSQDHSPSEGEGDCARPFHLGGVFFGETVQKTIGAHAELSDSIANKKLRGQ